MNKSAMPLFRLAGAFLGAATLFFIVSLIEKTGLTLPANWTYLAVIPAVLIGGLLGAMWLPTAVQRVQAKLNSLTAEQLAGVMLGAFIGLLAGALAAIPLRLLPAPLGQFVPAAIMVSLTYLGAATFAKRPHDLSEWLKSVRPQAVINDTAIVDSNGSSTGSSNGHSSEILLDTSVIIDGRITDISKTGFINSSLIVPNFVLTELQHIADSPDPIRRKRGRRGLEVLDVLQNDCPMPLEIRDMDVSEVREVDSKLVALARHTGAPIMTNDYNLNRVAGLQGVHVLNINDLANAVKAAHLPGEELVTKVIQEGREHGQGVGYLEDGTMVVVEDGLYHMNQTMHVVVTKVLQTSAGRMIFARVP